MDGAPWSSHRLKMEEWGGKAAAGHSSKAAAGRGSGGRVSSVEQFGQPPVDGLQQSEGVGIIYAGPCFQLPLQLAPQSGLLVPAIHQSLQEKGNLFDKINISRATAACSARQLVWPAVPLISRCFLRPAPLSGHLHRPFLLHPALPPAPAPPFTAGSLPAVGFRLLCLGQAPTLASRQVSGQGRADVCAGAGAPRGLPSSPQATRQRPAGAGRAAEAQGCLPAA